MCIAKSLVVFIAMSSFAASAVIRLTAAEFDVDAERVVLRQLQYCRYCGSALLVTRVHPGAMVRCPDCGHEQPRLAERYVLTQLYQLCRLCQLPLDAHGGHAGDTVECGNCHVRQTLSRDAFVLDANRSGLGYVPGFPPGSGKKTFISSREIPAAAIPIDDSAMFLPLGVIEQAKSIPRPPSGMLPRSEAPSPSESMLAAGQDPEGYGEAVSAAAAMTAIEQPLGHGPEQPFDVVDVPAVTADLFGGVRGGRPVEKHTDKGTGSGPVLARVEGTAIHASEVDRVLAPVLSRLREHAGDDDDAELAKQEETLRSEVLERLIDRELAIREAFLMGYSPDPAAVKERERELIPILLGSGLDVRREAERDVAMAEMRRRYGEKGGGATPQAVREYYHQNKDRMRRPRLLAMSQLVIYQERSGHRDRRNCGEIAAEVSMQLEQGKRFDEVRSLYDEFGAAGFSPADPPMLPESAYASQIFRDAGDLRKGAVFGPVFMEGMALFGKVVDERLSGPIPFEDVEKEIRRKLENEAAEKNFDQWLQQLRQKSEIEIYEYRHPQ